MAHAPPKAESKWMNPAIGHVIIPLCAPGRTCIPISSIVKHIYPRTRFRIVDTGLTVSPGPCYHCRYTRLRPVGVTSDTTRGGKIWNCRRR
jgi:hypothetical protein